MKCTHPPKRLYCWTAYDGTRCVACCDCGEILRGSELIAPDTQKAARVAEFVKQCEPNHR